MKKIRFISGIIMLSALTSIAQQNIPALGVKENSQHLIKDVNEERKQDSILRATDPEAHREKWRKVYVQRMENQAQDRLADYEANERMDTVKQINLTYMRLTKIPDFVSRASQLEKIVLDDNQIRRLPRYFKKLDRLTTISWANTHTKRKIRYPKLEQITHFSYGGHPDARLPNFGRLPNMIALNLIASGADDLPANELKRNVKLTHLTISESPLTLSGGNYDRLSALEVLKINKCSLASLHVDVYNIPRLKEMQLQENELTSLPDGISKMQSLSKLSFYKNKIQNLPIDFFSVPSLVVVDLYYNQLERIPASIKDAVNLEVLFIAHNKIYDLPETLGKLGKLNELYLHHNHLSALPASLKELKNMEVLRINDNFFTTFPEEILSLHKLSDLDIDNNMILQVPAEVAGLENLRLFTFDRNPVDFNSRENAGLAQAIYQMSQKGTICKPNILMDEQSDPTELD